MSFNGKSQLAGLDAANRIDSVCDAFEREWRDGKRPRIEDYLSDTTSSESSTLIVELAAIDAFYRRTAGETPILEEYIRRFPDAPALRDPSLVDSWNIPPESKEVVLKAIGTFNCIKIVGEGAFGCVWKARDTKLNRIVALKVPHAACLDDAAAAMLLREARSAARLQHPNIVAVFDTGRDGPAAYIVSEYIDGLNLKDWLRQNRATFDMSARICIKLATALQHAHDQGVVHRDLKPANIILDRHNEPHITDFGLAKWLAGDASTLPGKHILGTPAYMSPEQAAGNSKDVDTRSDVYSLGIILYELLTGRRAFEGDLASLLSLVMTKDPIRPRQILKEIPHDLETICLKAIDKDRDRRYETSRQFAADLQRYLDAEPIEARRPWFVSRAVNFSRRRFVGAALSSAALISSGVWIGLSRSRADRKHRLVTLKTDPPGAHIWFIPLSKVTGEPNVSQIIDARSSPVALELAPGDYLVEAVLDGQRFHEVYRHVPERTEAIPGVFAHQRFSSGTDGEIVLPAIRIPAASTTDGMAHLKGMFEFAMGHPGSARSPRHLVRMPTFFMDPFEFTFGQYKLLNGGRLPLHLRLADFPDDYAMPVAFDDAINHAEAFGKRLPDESEYEFAATAGGTLDIPWGHDDVIPEQAPETTFGPVGEPAFDRIDLDSRTPVYGLCSNLAEWTVNWPVHNPGNGPRVTPGLANPGDYRVVRGGTAQVIDGAATVSTATRSPRDRQSHLRFQKKPGLGFRCVRSARPRLTPEDFPRTIDTPRNGFTPADHRT